MAEAALALTLSGAMPGAAPYSCCSVEQMNFTRSQLQILR
jgi:hypothetical protein